MAFRNREDGWWRETKATDDFLDPLFEAFFAALKLPNEMRKSDYHRLASFVAAADVDQEIVAALDLIDRSAERATPRLG